MYRYRFNIWAKSREQIDKAFLLLIVGLVFLFVLTLNSFAWSKIVRGEEGWAIRQSSNFAGTVFSDITSHALRMHIGKLNLTIIAKAPQWNALVFNEASKTYIDLPYKDWQRRFTYSEKGNARGSSAKPALVVRRSGNVVNIGHFRTNEYWILRKAEPKKHISEEKVSQLWIALDIKAPMQISQIFCSHLGIPPQKGIPLKAKRCVKGKMVSALETLSVERRVIPSSTFQALPGYRKVKNEIELLMGDDNNAAMEDLLDMPTQAAGSKTGNRK